MGTNVKGQSSWLSRAAIERWAAGDAPPVPNVQLTTLTREEAMAFARVCEEWNTSIGDGVAWAVASYLGIGPKEPNPLTTPLLRQRERWKRGRIPENLGVDLPNVTPALAQEWARLAMARGIALSEVACEAVRSTLPQAMPQSVPVSEPLPPAIVKATCLVDLNEKMDTILERLDRLERLWQ